MRENSNINKALAYYIGYSTDDLIRYKASSGGIEHLSLNISFQRLNMIPL